MPKPIITKMSMSSSTVSETIIINILNVIHSIFHGPHYNKHQSSNFKRDRKL